MELHTRYTFEGTVPMRVTDEARGLDRSCVLHFEAACSLARTTASVTQEALKKAVVLSLQPAYMQVYPEGLTAKDLQAPPSEAVCAQALPSFTAALHMLGAEPEQLTLLSHRLGEEDGAAALFEAEAARTDAEAHAQELFKQQILVMRAKTHANGILWICDCGSCNDGNFCPECGQKRSYRKWSCPCGSLNDSPFCPECGRKFE